MKFLQTIREYKVNHKSTPAATEKVFKSSISEPRPIFSPQRSLEVSRASSAASNHSDVSKKLVWLLGPDALDTTGYAERPECLRQNSRLSQQIPQELRHKRSDSSLLSDSSDDSEDTTTTEEGKPLIAEVASPLVKHLSDVPAQISFEDESNAANLFSKDMQAPLCQLVAPDSPDVDSLCVSTFEPFTPIPSSETATPRYGSDTKCIEGEEEVIDFNEVCERLLDTLSTSFVRPSLEQHESGSSSASSKSSTMLFTEPASPQSFSSASSLNTLDVLDRMENAKRALVAEQAALDAKLKLAAARDALKRVRSNVVVPTTDAYASLNIHRPKSGPRAYTTQIRTSGHIRTQSNPERAETMPLMCHSRSSSSIDELPARGDRSSPRSSRSSRYLRGSSDMPLLTQKSDIKIGIAAPKDLSVLKQAGERPSHGRSDKQAGQQLKSRSKSALYVPQTHITSINEVLA